MPVRHAHYPVRCLLGIVVSMRQSFDAINAKVPFVVEARQSNFSNIVGKHFVLVRPDAVHRDRFRCHLAQALFVVGKSEALFHRLLHAFCRVLSANVAVLVDEFERVEFWTESDKACHTAPV